MTSVSVRMLAGGFFVFKRGITRAVEYDGALLETSQKIR